MFSKPQKRPYKKRKILKDHGEQDKVVDSEKSKMLRELLKKSTTTCNDKYLQNSRKLSDLYEYREYFIAARFQRSVKWKMANRLSLWVSLKEGVSPGCLTVWNENMIGKRGVNIIIDGQQRITTLFHMFDNPCTYILSRENIQTHLKKLCVFDLVREWIDTMKDMNMSELLDTLDDTSNSYSFMSFVSQKKFSKPERKKYVVQIAPSIQVAMKRECNIMDVDIHMDVYFGESTRTKMHDVYTRLNESGVQLTKFESFAPLCATTEKHILDVIKDKLVKFFTTRPLAPIDVKIQTIDTFTLYEFITGVVLYLRDKFPKFFECCYSKEPTCALNGISVQERKHKWDNDCIDSTSRLLLVIYGKSCYTELIDTMPWETLEQQQNMLDRLCNAIKECEAIHEPFEKPATKKIPYRHHCKVFIPNLARFAHVSSFFNCTSEKTRQKLRKYMFGHAFIESVLGTMSYNGQHAVKHHVDRVSDDHYTYPADPDTILKALDLGIFKTESSSKWNKRTIIIINILSYEYTIKEKMKAMDYEHMVAHDRCKEMQERGVPVDTWNIGNCGILYYVPNRKKGATDMVSYMLSTLPGVTVDDRQFKKRWQCCQDAVPRGHRSPRNFEEFIKKRSENIYQRMAKILNVPLY
jgi:hypothetical protein